MTGQAGETPWHAVHRVAETQERAASKGELAGRLLGSPRIVYRGAGDRGAVALTFDDGPSHWTAAIAAALEEHGCRATFFLRGAAVAAQPQEAAALARSGHELGSHLWSHANPMSQSRAEIRAEVKRTAAAIHAATGQQPQLLRPPYCKAPRKVARAASRLGVRMIVQRSLASSDWNAASPVEIVEPLLAEVRAGDIVCLHDGVAPGEPGSATREVTLAAVRRLVPELIARDLRPVTVSSLLEPERLVSAA